MKSLTSTEAVGTWRGPVCPVVWEGASARRLPIPLGRHYDPKAKMVGCELLPL